MGASPASSEKRSCWPSSSTPTSLDIGLEEADGVRALVMELVEGNDLSVLIARGPMPFDETRTIALQIAEALEEAHEKGIVHRDLKPANVKVAANGKVKVLDFGLAKAMDPASGPGKAPSNSPTLMNSPTLTTAGTQVGVILGTAAYMSPEQAKGQSVDKRADVWAFGVVVYEMLTGRRLFSGDSIPETLAGVLKTDIDFSSLPPTTPAATRQLLERCLERDPKRRLRDIGEARIALSAAPGDVQRTPVAPPATSRTRERFAFSLAACFAPPSAGRSSDRGTPKSHASPLRLHLPPPEGGEFTDSDPVVLSPNGDSITFVTRTPEGERSLAVRSLDALDTRTFPEPAEPTSRSGLPTAARSASSTPTSRPSMRAASSRPGNWRRSRTGAGRAGAAPGSSSTRRTPPARSTASTPPAESRAPPRRSIRPAARRRTCGPAFCRMGSTSSISSAATRRESRGSTRARWTAR